MKFVLVLVAALIASPVVAKPKVDARLATVRQAWVEPQDALGDDRQVAACVAERLTRVVPLTLVTDRAAADVVLTISRASIGKHPKADIAATLADGTTAWEGGSKTRGFNLIGRNMTCVIADDLLSNLRNAMRKAREGK